MKKLLALLVMVCGSFAMGGENRTSHYVIPAGKAFICDPATGQGHVVGGETDQQLLEMLRSNDDLLQSYAADECSKVFDDNNCIHPANILYTGGVVRYAFAVKYNGKMIGSVPTPDFLNQKNILKAIILFQAMKVQNQQAQFENQG